MDGAAEVRSLVECYRKANVTFSGIAYKFLDAPDVNSGETGLSMVSLEISDRRYAGSVGGSVSPSVASSSIGGNSMVIRSDLAS